MVNDRVNIAKRLRKTPEELAKENFYDDASYKIEPLLFEMVYEIVCGSDEGSYDDVFIKAADLIDPTCKPVITVENLTESLTKYTSECSECGAIFGDFPTREQAETTHPTYCPCCGSRVITPNFGKDNDNEC